MERLEFTQEGSVVRISMKNFMTYKHETIYPGPNFNVTVGPNGSGKSSIVTALSICLGGDLKSLNRQQDLNSLINNEAGKNPAEVEIELFSKNGVNKIVKVIISKSSSELKWVIDGKPSNLNKLTDLTKRLQIQPGNLCQFLPQDVVRDFPQMKPPQIFENTIKAVGDIEMLSKLRRGGEIQSEIEKIDNDLKTKKNTLSSNEQKEKKLEGDMKIIDKREKIKEKKEIYIKALKWQKFKTLRAQVKETRDKKRDLDKQAQDVEEKLIPTREFLKDYDKKVADIKADVDKLEKELQMIGREVEEFDTTELEDELERQVECEKDLTQDEEIRKSKKERITKEIAELEEYLDTHPLDPTLEGKTKDLKEKRDKFEGFIATQQPMVQDTENLINIGNREIKKLKKQEEDLLNKKNRNLMVLEQQNPDTYKGVLWLRENLDKFKSKVHEPIMLCMDVKNTDYSKYLEFHIGRADLDGFVCEDPDDMNLLLKELREVKKLRKVNAVHSNPTPKEKFSSPFREHELRKFGFVAYLCEMYEAPLAVNAYLCQQKNLHQVPFFKEENEHTDDLKNKFQSFYIGGLKFTAKRSKYSKELSTGIDDISSRRPIRLSDNIDTSALENVKAELENKKKALENNTNRLNQKNQSIHNMRLKMDDLTAEIQGLESKKKEFNKAKAELDMKVVVLKSLAQPKCNIEEEKAKIKRKKIELVRELCERMKSGKEKAGACARLDLEKRCKQLQLQNIETENQDQTDQLKELEKDYKRLNDESNACQIALNEEKLILRRYHNEALEATDGTQDEKVKIKPPLKWQEKFSMLGSLDENALQVNIEDFEEELNKLKVSPDTEKRIKEIRESVQKSKTEVENMEKEKESKTKELGQLRKGWIEGVRKMVSQVGDKFSEMMATLGYSGQIELIEGKDNELDLKNYGVKIMVKFRDQEEFQELTKGTQSGGEKSVTTAVYMMALQGLTHVPFRCVDEINQGMDEKNERKVWDMLLEVCREHQAQYFYMAPKFPYNLPFDNQVTILLCNSGSSRKKSSTDFCTETFIKRSRTE